LGIASPSEIWRVAVQIDSSLTIQDINFELYYGTRDPKNSRYKKIGKGKYALLTKNKNDIQRASGSVP